MMPDSAFQSHSIGGFASSSQHHAHLRSISFDQAYLPPTPPPKNDQSFEHTDGYSIPATRQEGVHDLYPIVAWTFEPDLSSQSQVYPEEDDSASSIATPTKETILDRARANSKSLKRKLSSLAPKKQASCSRLREGRELPDLDLHPVPPLPLGAELDALDRYADLYDSPPSTSSSWSTSTSTSTSSSSHRPYSQWEAIHLRVSIYLYWKKQALARKLSFRSE